MEHTYRTMKPGNKDFKILCEKFITPIRTGYVEIDQGVCVLSDEYLKYCKDYEEFEVHEEDIFVAGYPRAGTTWTQEMVWMIANNLNFQGGTENLVLRFPLLEQSVFLHNNLKKTNFVTLERFPILNKTQGRRFIKSHLPWSLLPTQIQTGEKEPKIIYIMRNPKDTCVSGYHLFSIFGFSGNFEEYAEMFLTGQSMFSKFIAELFKDPLKIMEF